MRYKIKKLTDSQEIAQEEQEIRREYFVFVPLLLIIVGLIAFSATRTNSRVAVELVQPASNSGYWIVYDNGEVENFGTAQPATDIDFAIDRKIVAAQAADIGFWAINDRGRVFSVSDAQYAGGIDGAYEEIEALDMITHPSNKGYRVVARSGPVYDFNIPAVSGGESFNKPVGAAISTQSGNGYWIIEPNGTIATFGDATNFSKLEIGDEEIIDGGQYGNGVILLSNKGGVVVLGNGQYEGDMTKSELKAPLVDIDGMKDGTGYRIMAIDGKVTNFGSAQSLQTY